MCKLTRRSKHTQLFYPIRITELCVSFIPATTSQWTGLSLLLDFLTFPALTACLLRRFPPNVGMTRMKSLKKEVQVTSYFEGKTVNFSVRNTLIYTSHCLIVLTGHLNSVGTTRGSPSPSQTLATQASRNTKSPQCPTPHSTMPRSSKRMGKNAHLTFAPSHVSENPGHPAFVSYLLVYTHIV